MATVSPISPGAGDLRPLAPVKSPAIAVQPDVTSAPEDILSLSPEAVQLIQAAGLAGYENQELAEASAPEFAAGNISEGLPAGTALQLVE
jgi:hypothetical protein